MAVIDGLPGVKVSIRLNGSAEDCTEYDDPKASQTTASRGAATHSISKAIESQDDAKFSVHYEFKDARRWIKDNRVLVVAIYIDGRLCESQVYDKSKLKGQVLRKHVEGVTDVSAKPGQSIFKNFMFTKIKQVDESGSRITEDLEVVNHLGKIEVIIYRAVKHGRKRKSKPSNVMSKTELAEKAMKGKNLSHGTGFSEGRNVPNPRSVTCTYPDGELRLARFIFRYKSKMALQIEGIIPRDPSPEYSSEPQPRNAADLPMEEIQRLAQERLDQLAMVKLESKAGVKREADDDIKLRISKVYTMTSDGAIDLTE
ncbi:hypothetical protein CGRA01v4_00984 [Colletotrichum graminicola]|uniref:DUF7918 domain-containing protein n=1 Tax=Colletotrichum graminicola (strain M1.001 / M2 / FGSC 10212) TaxID=645133 RepID=E3QGW5_COLGM|nr:uncharacterized protein GLRG_05247 [Colletotrichum graminicola M1.001]EFQ30103.1 hypothetical protein GLRG_05247 [Colletotrichum graminicola M1.001]WDK09706.1 hypothetical protein CGRA01v4_00984 [Colletotrichum graminicola]